MRSTAPLRSWLARWLVVVISGGMVVSTAVAVTPPGFAGYDYDTTASVVAAAHNAAPVATTPPADMRTDARHARLGLRTESRSSMSSFRLRRAAKGGTSIVKHDADFAIGQLTSRGARASDLTRLAESQGWRRVQNPNGPIKYLDDGGVPRLTLKSGSARAPGSNLPHVEIRNAAGRRVDPYGNPVTRRSPGNHTGIEWDLP